MSVTAKQLLGDLKVANLVSNIECTGRQASLTFLPAVSPYSMSCVHVANQHSFLCCSSTAESIDLQASRSNNGHASTRAYLFHITGCCADVINTYLLPRKEIIGE